MFSISLRSEFSPDKAAEQMSRFPGSCNVEMWGECVSASKAGCGFSVVHPPSWPEPTHGNINIKSCTSAPKCTWWIFFRYRCSKQHKAGVIWPLFLTKTEPQPAILTPNSTTNHGEDYCWYNLASLLLPRVCENVHKASTLVWPIYNERNTSLSERILLLTVGYFLYIHFLKPGILFTLSHTQAPSCRSPVWRVPQLRPRVGDLLSVFHPEALSVRSLGSGEVTQQSDRF